MAKPSTRQELVNYALRQLGARVGGLLAVPLAKLFFI